MTSFDVSGLYERLGEVLSRLGGQDKAISSVDIKVDRNFVSMDALRQEVSAARHGTDLLSQRVDALREDHAKLDKRLVAVADQLSSINAAAGLARTLLNWRPLTVAVLGLGLLLKDWLGKKLGL